MNVLKRFRERQNVANVVCARETYITKKDFIYKECEFPSEYVPTRAYNIRNISDNTAARCLGSPCERAVYRKSENEPDNPALWCSVADSAVIDLDECPESLWKKDKNQRPYPGFCDSNCMLFQLAGRGPFPAAFCGKKNGTPLDSLNECELVCLARELSPGEGETP